MEDEDVDLFDEASKRETHNDDVLLYSDLAQDEEGLEEPMEGLEEKQKSAVDLYGDLDSAPSSKRPAIKAESAAAPDSSAVKPNSKSVVGSSVNVTSASATATPAIGQSKTVGKPLASALVPASQTVYVGNLNWWTTDQNIIDACASVGVHDVIRVSFYEERKNGKSKGCASVDLGSELSAKTVEEKLPLLDVDETKAKFAVTNSTKTIFKRFLSLYGKDVKPTDLQMYPTGSSIQAAVRGSNIHSVSNISNMAANIVNFRPQAPRPHALAGMQPLQQGLPLMSGMPTTSGNSQMAQMAGMQPRGPRAMGPRGWEDFANPMQGGMHAQMQPPLPGMPPMPIHNPMQMGAGFDMMMRPPLDMMMMGQWRGMPPNMMQGYDDYYMRMAQQGNFEEQEKDREHRRDREKERRRDKDDDRHRDDYDRKKDRDRGDDHHKRHRSSSSRRKE